jgi:hypothetical protein
MFVATERFNSMKAALKAGESAGYLQSAQASKLESPVEKPG